MDDEIEAALTETPAPTMGRLGKMRYTHADMIDYIINNPGTSQGDLAARYGYSQGWVSNIMASDAWQSAFAKRREELIDPTLRLTLEERFRGLAARSLERLMEKLDQPQVSDGVVLKAVELGARGVEVGGFGRPQATPPAPVSPDHLAQLANRLIDLQAGIRSKLVEGVTYENVSAEGG